MALPSAKDPTGTLIRTGKYTIARVQADRTANHLAPTLAQAQADLLSGRNARVAADDTVLATSAAKSAREQEVLDALSSLGAKAYGLYESYAAAGYRRILPLAPSKVVGVGEAERMAAYTTALEALAKDTPAELAATAAALTQAHAAFITARTAHLAAVKALSEAQSAEAAACDAWHTAIRRLKAQLSDLFPRTPGLVHSFFPAGNTKKKTAATGPAGPVTPA